MNRSPGTSGSGGLEIYLLKRARSDHLRVYLPGERQHRGPAIERQAAGRPVSLPALSELALASVQLFSSVK